MSDARVSHALIDPIRIIMEGVCSYGFTSETGVSEKEFLDKMIALAKAGEDEMEHLKCMFYAWADFL